MNDARRPRLDLIDHLRGLAVALMLLWHTADGWASPAVRAAPVWNNLRGLGGMAAPLFFLLAGASFALRPEGGSLRADVKRGLSLVAFGYLLRWQLWTVDSLAFRTPLGALCVLLVGSGMGLVAHTLWAPSLSSKALWTRCFAGITVWSLGLALVAHATPAKLLGLVRVDVLQGIGASLVVIAVVVRASRVVRAPAALVCAALALLVTLVTGPLEARMPAGLPGALAGYVARWTVAGGGRAPTLFPLAPWLGYALAGVALGAALAWASRHDRLGRVVLALTLAGALASPCFDENRADVAAMLARHPLWVATVRMAWRLSLAMALLGPSWALARWDPSRRSPLLALGQRSLVVYWLHLELAFGLIGWPLHRTLGVGAWCVSWLALTALMAWVARRWPPRWITRLRAIGASG